jgi:hypothetical protein
MLWVLPIVAWVQQKYDLALVVLNRVRRRLLLPIAHWGGRDMALLTNGQWLDAGRGIRPEQVRWRYDSERHVLVREGAAEARLVRWPWLSVESAGQDLSEFFQGLRLSVGHQLTDDKAIMLFAHQKGWLPAGDLHIVRRDGSEETYTLDADGVHVRREPAAAAVAEHVEQINYVK